MEKADILEMAVKHLRQIQRQQYTSGGADPTLSDKYRLGFNECAQEVSRYLGAADDDDAELRARLLNHLANCITSSDSPSPLHTPSSSPGPPIHSGQVSSTGGSSAVDGNVGGVVTPLAPIPMRPGSKAGNLTAFSLVAQGGGGGGVGGNPPSAALVVPTTEINNNVASFANNNIIVSSAMESGSVLGGGGGGGGVGFRSVVSHHVALATATSSLASLPTATTASSSTAATKVIGELQMLPSKTATGAPEVAFVLPANVMPGGHLHSYIIPVYTSHPGLTAASLALANNAAPSGLQPAQLPLMAIPQVSASAAVPGAAPAAAAAAPNLVTLAPAGSSLCPAVLPPSTVAHHVVTTGLQQTGAPLAWNPPATVYASPPAASTSSSTSSSAFSSSSSSAMCVQAPSPASASGLTPPSPVATVTSAMRGSEESSSTPFLLAPTPEKSSQPQLLERDSRSALFLHTGGAVDSEGRYLRQSGVVSGSSSVLHSQLVRGPPQAPAELLRARDESVWRPW